LILITNGYFSQNASYVKKVGLSTCYGLKFLKTIRAYSKLTTL